MVGEKVDNGREVDVTVSVSCVVCARKMICSSHIMIMSNKIEKINSKHSVRPVYVNIRR